MLTTIKITSMFSLRLLSILLMVSSCGKTPQSNVAKEDPAEEGEAITYKPGSKIIYSFNSDAENPGSEESYPLILAEPSQVCRDITYYDRNGEQKQGSRLCDQVSSDPNLKSENLKSGVTIEGVTGTILGAEGFPELIPENIKLGTDIAGIQGTFVPRPADCTTDGESGCVSTTNFVAVLEAGLANKVIAGQTVAGIAGNFTLPAENKVLSGTSYGTGGTSALGTLTLPAAANVLSSFGNFGDPSAPITPSLSADLPDVANVRAGDTVNGVSGTLADCSSDGATNCVTSNSFKAADVTNITAGNIRSGVTIAGQAGNYPSSTYPLPSASGTADLDFATFTAKVKSSTAFEYWSSDGTYHTGAGDTNIAAANILTGVSIFGTSGNVPVATCSHGNQGDCEAVSACRWTGSVCEVNPFHFRTGVTIYNKAGAYKANCRERANSAIFDSDGMGPGNTATTAGSTIHWWDVIHNYNNNANTLPTEQPAGWTSDHACGKELWSDLTADGACDSAADDCLMKDNITELIWTESYPVTGTAAAGTFLDWSSAVAHCYNLTYGGRSDWRLPTIMELSVAYNHGIRQLGYTGGGTIRPSGDTLDNNDVFIANVDTSTWSATTRAGNGWGEYLMLAEGRTTSLAKTTNTSNTVLCVAP